ncbi:MAG: tetratricopeptide repeat protein [Gemmatimonadota bacterium]|jgi:tetratricopeptide (TPR) repeat protein
MKAWSAFTLVAALAVPAAVSAQRKPSANLQTRSAEVYLNTANEKPEKREEFLQKALDVLVEGSEQDGDNPLVWFMLGQVYARLGDPVGADSAFDKAEALYPDYTEETAPERLAVWINEYNAGIAAIQANDPAGAIARFEKADAIYRGRPDAALTLGSLYAQTGDLVKAEAAYRTALEITRGPSAANVPPADRAQWAQQEETAATRLGDMLVQLGRTDEAIEVYRELVANQPENAVAQSALAATLAKAGKNDEAAAIYEKLLTRDDLSDIEWFNAGVGLYTANNYDLAIKAFEKSLEVNPYSRDATYNLGQAILGAATELGKQRENAPDAEKAAIGEKMKLLFQELAAAADRLRDMDPNHRAPLMMLAQAQRSLGDLAADRETTRAWQEKVLATLQVAEDMPFEVSSIQTMPDGGTLTVSGTITNLKGTEGQSVTVDFTLLGEGGEALATQPVTATLPAADAQTEFSFTVETDQPVLGWRYKVAG